MTYFKIFFFCSPERASLECIYKWAGSQSVIVGNKLTSVLFMMNTILRLYYAVLIKMRILQSLSSSFFPFVFITFLKIGLQSLFKKL